MSERIDQDPNINHLDTSDAATEAFRVPNAAQQPRGYRETPLSEAAGVHFATDEAEAKERGLYFPDHIPSHVVANPDHAAVREVIPSPDNQKPSYLKRGLAVLAGAAVLGGGGILVGKALGKNEAYENILVDQPSASMPMDTDNSAYEKYPVKLTAENATSNQFLNQDSEYPYAYTRAEQLNYAGVELNTDAQATAERMRDKLRSLGFPSNFTDENLTTRRIVQADISNTPQQIWDQYTVGAFQVWETAQTEGTDEAKKLAIGTSDPQSVAYTNQIELFSSTTGTIDEGVAWDEKPVITSGDYEGVVATAENPIITFKKTSVFDTNDQIKVVMRLEKGDKPNSTRWILVKKINLS